jgi:flagellar biosynthesis/type III secretory pathway protein FliH
MQTHSIKFTRPLMGVSGKAGGSARLDSSPNRANPSTASDSETFSELGKTGESNDDTSPPPIDVQKLLLAINQNLEETRRSKDEALRELQEFSIQLATQIANAIVLYEVKHHDTRIRKLLESYLETNEHQNHVVVRVNKTDMDRLQASLPDSPSLDLAIQFKQDDSITTGDCQIESAQQSVVASFDRQLAELHEGLMECLEHARSEG